MIILQITQLKNFMNTLLRVKTAVDGERRKRCDRRLGDWKAVKCLETEQGVHKIL